MKRTSARHQENGLAIALPILYSLHLLEERFAGIGFPSWLNQTMGAHLSMTDFAAINAVAFSIVLLVSILFVRGILPFLPVLMIGTVFFINGLIHLGTSVATYSYSPGVLTGIVLYLPLGFYTWKTICPGLSRRVILQGISGGILLHALVIALALNI